MTSSAEWRRRRRVEGIAFRDVLTNKGERVIQVFVRRRFELFDSFAKVFTIALVPVKKSFQ